LDEYAVVAQADVHVHTRDAGSAAQPARGGRPNRRRSPRRLVGHRTAPDRPAGHTLHVEPNGAFSIVAVVWRPGQVTPIHDHTTWCVFGVLQGLEHEDVFDADLNMRGQSDNRVGDVNGFAPPGDIHRVHNTGDEVAISVHIYGTDVTRIGSSVRRYYE
jgi:3-mercaptopropionate dioxygenase